MPNSPNPFYVDPLGGHNPLAGLGALYKGMETGRQRKEEERLKEERLGKVQEAIKIYKSGDYEAANIFAIQNPDVGKELDSIMGSTDKRRKSETMDNMINMLASGDVSDEAIQRQADLISSMGGDPKNTLNLLNDPLEDRLESIEKMVVLNGGEQGKRWLDYKKLVGGDPVDGIPIDRDKNIVNPRTGEVIYQGATGGVKPLPRSYTAGLTPEGAAQVNDAFLSAGGGKDGEAAARKERVSVKGADRWKELEPVLKRRFPNATPEEMTEMIDSAKAHEKFSAGIVAAEKLSETHEKKRAFEGEINSVNEAYKILVGGKDGVTEGLDMIYGSKEWMMPDIARSQKGKEMLAARKQIVSTLKLAAAGKLKGQGTISESERTTLAEAATILGDESISPPTALKQLNLAMEIIYAKVSKEFVPYQSGVAGQEGEVIPETAKKQNQLSRLEQLKARRGGR